MSFESVLEGLTKAVQENTAAIRTAIGAPASPPTPSASSTPAKAVGRPKRDKPVETTKSGPTKDDIRAQTLLAVNKHKLNEPLRALLTKMGVEKASELAENQYDEYMTEVGKLIADPKAGDPNQFV